jgi:hypothetical protein
MVRARDILDRAFKKERSVTKLNRRRRIGKALNLEHRLQRVTVALPQNRVDPLLKKGLPGQITYPNLSLAKAVGYPAVVRAWRSQMSRGKMQRPLLLYFVPWLPTPIKKGPQARVSAPRWGPRCTLNTQTR